MSQFAEEILNDLYNVGKTKSLGYLPIETVINICNKNVNDIIEYANKNNLNVLILNCPEDCDIYSGAIYIYNESMLSNILKKYSTVLSNAGIPNDNNLKYIRYISNGYVSEEKYPEAYKVVGLTFNDKRFIA